MVRPLFPVFSPAPITTNPEPADAIFGTGFAFDFETGDFVVDGNGRLVEIGERDQFVQWISTVMITERNVFPVFTPDFGVDVERLIGTDTRSAEAEAQAVIEDALLNADQRIYMLKDFQFERSGTTLSVSFWVVPSEGAAIPQRFTIEA